MQSVTVNHCWSLPHDKTVIVVGLNRVEGASDLVHGPVSIRDLSISRRILKHVILSQNVKLLVFFSSLHLCPKEWSCSVVMPYNTAHKYCIYDQNIFGAKFIVLAFLFSGREMSSSLEATLPGP